MFLLCVSTLLIRHLKRNEVVLAITGHDVTTSDRSLLSAV